MMFSYHHHPHHVPLIHVFRLTSLAWSFPSPVNVGRCQTAKLTSTVFTVKSTTRHTVRWWVTHLTNGVFINTTPSQVYGSIFSYEGKTIMKPPYLYNGDFHTDKTVPFTEFSWFIPRTNWPPYYRTQFQLYFIWNLYPFLSLLLLFCIIWKSLNVVLIIRLPIN